MQSGRTDGAVAMPGHNQTSLTTVRQLVERCPAVSTCIGAVARAVAELEVRSEGRALTLLNRPNPVQTGYQFRHGIVSDLLACVAGA